MDGDGKRPEWRGGFTLLELVAVIGIVAIMVTLAVGGFSGMMAATTENTAWQTLQRAFNLARQEACVEGVDTYVFVVDVNRFAIVRKAGTITGTIDDGEPQAWGPANGKVTARWIVDDFADLSDREDSRKPPNEENMTQAERDQFASDYDGELVFDISRGVAAKVKAPVKRVLEMDAWVFGIEDLPDPAPKTAHRFEVGHRYGWITHPVFALPEGWVFRGSYHERGEKAGLFNHKDIKVHFTGGGDVASDSTEMPIVIENPARGRSLGVIVDNAGVRPVQDDGNEGE